MHQHITPTEYKTLAVTLRIMGHETIAKFIDEKHNELPQTEHVFSRLKAKTINNTHSIAEQIDTIKWANTPLDNHFIELYKNLQGHER